MATELEDEAVDFGESSPNAPTTPSTEKTGEEILDSIFKEDVEDEFMIAKPEPSDQDPPENPEAPEVPEVPELPEPPDPTPAEPPEAPEPEDDELDPKSGRAWAKLKAELKEAKAELAKAKELPAKDPKVDELTQQLEQMEDKLGKYSLADTSAFKRKYDMPIQTHLAKATRLLTQCQLEPKDARDLATKLASADPQTRLEKFAEEAPPAIQGALVLLYDELDDMRQARAVAIQNWREVKAAHAHEEESNKSAAAMTAVTAAFGSAVEELKASGNILFKDETTSEAWNAAVKRRLAATEGVLKSADVKTLARYVTLGTAMDTLQAMYDKERTTRLQLQQQLDGVVQRSPHVTGRAPRAPGAPDKPKTGDQILNELFGPEM